MTLWLRLAAWLGQVESRHWVAMGASALLHLAVVLGFRQPSPPPPETVSFEIALQPPEEARLKVPKAKSSKVADKARPGKVAKAKQIKPKAVSKEPHTLDAAFKAEQRPQKDAPAVSLPKAETQVAEAAQAPAQALPNVAQASAATGAKAVASAGGAESPATGGAGPVAGGSSAPSGEAGLALAAAHILSLAPGGGEVSQGAEASPSPGSATEGAQAGAGPASFSASGSVGGGLNVAAGTGANLHSASPSAPLSGGEPQGLRLTASGTLSSQPEFAQGKGGLASGHLALEAGAASPVEGQGRGQAQALASAQAGGASVSPLPIQAAGPGKGGQGAAIERPAATRQAGGAGPAPGRLAGAQVPDRSLSGPQVSKRAGNTSQEGKTLALAPGEPGSGPQWAIPMVPVQAGVPMPSGHGRGAPDKQGGQGTDQVATAPGGGDSVAGGTGTGAVRLALAPGGGLASVVPKGVAGSGGGAGGRSVAPVVGPTAPGGGASAGQGRGMSSVQPAEQKIVRPDSRVETLDVLAPSNYCPLPIHAQPDNRPPQAPADRLELPSYAMNNPSFVYPVMANVYGVEGKLIMRVQVQKDGTPGQMLLKQSSGNGMLDKDAREQLARWRFNPARKNGQAVTAWVDVPVTYRLPEGRK